MQIDSGGGPDAVGGKAFCLRRLSEFCQVPPFFTISFDKPGELEEENNQSLIRQECSKRGFDILAVRSSASCEDSAKASFAGMFETKLGVRPADLISAVRAVLRSTNSERVSQYAAAQHVDPHAVKMSVIVQLQLRSRVSGVCFTRSHAAPALMTIEASLGLGEALVSGKVTPDLYIVDRSTLEIKEQRVSYQSSQLLLGIGEEAGTHYERVSSWLMASRKLTDAELHSVAKTALVIEKHMGFRAADIEWAIQDEDLFVVQARPYTAFIE